MQPTYRVAPVMLCYAPAKSFPSAVNALRFGRVAADGFRVGYVVYRVLAGRLLRLETFRPGPKGARSMNGPLGFLIEPERIYPETDVRSWASRKPSFAGRGVGANCDVRKSAGAGASTSVRG